MRRTTLLNHIQLIRKAHARGCPMRKTCGTGLNTIEGMILTILKVIPANFRLSYDTGKIKINKFPIIAYAYTDEGYKTIYQGITVVPQLKLEKTFELNIELIIS